MSVHNIDITCEGLNAIEAGLSILWDKTTRATHYKIAKYKRVYHYYPKEGPATGHCWDTVAAEDGIATMILLCRAEADAQPLPYQLITVQQAARFLYDWVEGWPYPSEPPHDGDNKKGWRLFNEAWGHVANLHCAIAAIQPRWIIYSK